MTTIIRLAWASLLNRRGAALLTIISIALSVAMLLGVEKLRRDAKAGFTNTISGTDLIVGARSGSVQLLLYSVFRIGNATNNISWQSYQKIAATRGVAWTVPISLGDSHRGYRVMGTSQSYFEHYRYGQKQNLQFADGGMFEDPFDVVIGAEVANKLGYSLGQSIVLSHGTGDLQLQEHDDKPFNVVGILSPTGTPVDRTLHVSLAGIEAIHVDWQDGRRQSTGLLGKRPVAPEDLVPKNITAFLISVERKTQIFSLQRTINTMRTEPLLAIIPGAALQELWDLMRVAEQTLQVISIFIVATSLLGMLTVILATLEARRREMAVLRAVGARLSHLAGLFVAEALVLAVMGIAAGFAVLAIATAVAKPIVFSQFGIFMPYASLSTWDWSLLALVLGSALVISIWPAWRAYSLSLSDGLSIRI
ncbi:MAG: ABC transporter permease [Burkholderiaceae bacterium]